MLDREDVGEAVAYSVRLDFRKLLDLACENRRRDEDGRPPPTLSGSQPISEMLCYGEAWLSATRKARSMGEPAFRGSTHGEKRAEEKRGFRERVSRPSPPTGDATGRVH